MIRDLVVLHTADRTSLSPSLESMDALPSGYRLLEAGGRDGPPLVPGAATPHRRVRVAYRLEPSPSGEWFA